MFLLKMRLTFLLKTRLTFLLLLQKCLTRGLLVLYMIKLLLSEGKWKGTLA